MDWTALFLSLKLALVATTILMLLTAPLACLLAYSRLLNVHVRSQEG